MEMSIYSLITELCSSLAADMGDFPSKEKFLGKMKAKAFEILLSHRNEVSPNEEVKDDAYLIFEIQNHVYWTAKDKGDWCPEMNEIVQEQMNKVELALQDDHSVASVLKLLCLLAESASSMHQSKVPSYGLDLSTLISDGSLKYNPLTKGHSAKIYDITPITEVSTDINISPSLSNSFPGTGLRHQEFFAPPTIDHESTRTSSQDNENLNLNNANWEFPSLEENGSKRRSANRGDNHPDEGYVTPNYDLKTKDEGQPYIPWERMYLTDCRSVYTWESCGRARPSKEPPFLTESREATDHFWKVVHSKNLAASAHRNQPLAPVVLKPVTLQEFERDYKYLLTGVKSNIFKFSKEKKSFVLQEGVYLKGISEKTLQLYCDDFIQCGNCFRYLTNLLQKQTSTKRGNVFKALCSDIQRYLHLYWGIVLQTPPLRSLLHMSQWLHGLRSHLQFLVSLCQGLPRDYALLTYLYNQVPLVSHRDLSFLLYSILQTCCTVYFVMLQRWIFKGVCDDKHGEFFILHDGVKPPVMDKMTWNRMYQLNRTLVPSFLKGLEKELLECGKSMALLKMCAPEDPICLELKKGYPGVVCCLNRAQTDALREECRLYELRCSEHCTRVYGELTEEVTKDEAYYSALRAKSYEKIKEAQARHKQVAADKKRKAFDELKKGMEDAEARKLEYRRSQVEEEERLILEEEQVYHLNEMRKEEEKNKILQYYTAISDAADQRKAKAEWKIKRTGLYDKRTQFFQESKKLEASEFDSVKCDPENTYVSSNTEQSSEEETSEKMCDTIEEPSAIVGSGDFAIVQDTDVTDEARSQRLVLTSNKFTGGSISEVGKMPIEPENPPGAGDEHREYMIALDVAEKARQSAAKFKERNMFNDYNIVTGEEKTYESRFFGSKDTKGPVEIAQESDAKQTSLETSVQTQEEKSVTEVLPSGNVQTEMVKEEPTQTLIVPGSPLNTTNVQDRAISQDLKAASSLSNKEKSSPKEDLKIDEIDMTTVYENLRMSVMIPLLTQQALANKAVLRLLFEKHNLMKHLECIRNHFFLLDGEFGRNLTRQLFTEVQTVDNPQYIFSVRLNSLLRSAVGVSADEECTERLSFYIKEVPDSFNLTDAKTLDCLSMRYRTEWPLSAVIHEEMIIRFDLTFSFLMKIKRVSWALEQIAYLLKDKRLYDSPQFRQIQLHRHIMTHFVNNLNNYVTAVVLEETWAIFKSDLAKSKTMSDIINNIKDYCKIVHFRSFHSKRLKPFLDSLVDLFGHILFYYELLRRNDWEKAADSNVFVHPRFNELYHHWASFLALVNYLVRYLDIANTRQVYAEFLDKLETMLCANNFYRNLLFQTKEKEEKKKITD